MSGYSPPNGVKHDIWSVWACSKRCRAPRPIRDIGDDGATRWNNGVSCQLRGLLHAYQRTTASVSATNVPSMAVARPRSVSGERGRTAWRFVATSSST
jgi:hypothetical protein